MFVPYFLEHLEYFDGELSNKPGYGIELKANAPDDIIQSYLREMVGLEDNTINYDEEALSDRMIEKFKQTKCYQSKSEEERLKTIKYLIDHPGVYDKDVLM